MHLLLHLLHLPRKDLPYRTHHLLLIIVRAAQPVVAALRLHCIIILTIRTIIITILLVITVLTLHHRLPLLSLLIHRIITPVIILPL
ncbi:hypothetical protein BDF20DRAFT_876700 [Mycotypha africana]|uniref:uncharacterized protein n=1 Tax=Mycotypha africana TaxID=64632 RepID=UPI002300FE95|nr:uncharacterized protein BDF20DRAFT_876700 [Mycotypha africana]KAI8975052.1 hypothetical protein BDF20DRAFT_876700 [Mycotypha africana]